MTGNKATEVAVENAPPPVPRKIETVEEAAFATAKSGTPSPLKSAEVIANDARCAASADGGPNEGVWAKAAPVKSK